MAKAHSEIRTTKASYYLQMLCKHWSHKLPVAFTPTRGVVPFPGGAECRMDAEDDTLMLVVEADDAEKVRRFKSVVIDHLKRFAHGEDLGAIVWRAA